MADVCAIFEAWLDGWIFTCGLQGTIRTVGILAGNHFVMTLRLVGYAARLFRLVLIVSFVPASFPSSFVSSWLNIIVCDGLELIAHFGLD